MQDASTTLFGNSQRERAEVLRWMSFVNMEVQPNLANWFKPLIGRRAYTVEGVERARKATNRAVDIIEAHLMLAKTTYFVSETITLADLLAASSLSRGYQYVFDLEWQENYPFVTKWFKNMVQQPIWHRVVPEPRFVTEAVRYLEDTSIDSSETNH